MNNKMAKIYTYQQLNLKNKLSKREEQRQNHGYRECFHGYQMGSGGGGSYRGMGEEVRWLRITNKYLQNRHGDVKYSIENEVAKELISWSMDVNNGMRIAWGIGGWMLGGGRQREKNQDNSIA